MLIDIALDRGQVSGTLERIPYELINPTRRAPMAVSDDAEARVVLGKALCANARPREGVAELREAIKRYTLTFSPLDPYLARTLSISGLCALQAGDRRQAHEWSRQAREALEVNLDVSDYFKKPLRELEARLAALPTKRQRSR